GPSSRPASCDGRSGWPAPSAGGKPPGRSRRKHGRRNAKTPSSCKTRGGQAGEPAARPGPLEVVAADSPIDVEDLATEEEPLAEPRRHAPHVHLGQRHAA